MTDRKLFGSSDFMKDFINHNLEQIEILDGGWSTRYVDKKSGVEWLKYTVDPERGYYYNLVQSKPALTTDDLLEIAFSSSYIDEVVAAANRLYHTDDNFREQLLNKLHEIIKKPLSNYDKERIKNIILAARLNDKSNRKDILGKHYTEVFADADYFIKISNQASDILAKLKA